MEWRESRPQGDHYTLFQLRARAVPPALTEFWRVVLTDGRRLAADWDWRELVFRVGTSTISAWFADATHRRLVPVLFELVCPEIEGEYDRLPQEDGDVTDEALEQFHARYCPQPTRAAAGPPVAAMLRQWQRERPVPVVAELFNGWQALSLPLGAEPGAAPDTAG